MGSIAVRGFLSGQTRYSIPAKHGKRFLNTKDTKVTKWRELGNVFEVVSRPRRSDLRFPIGVGLIDQSKRPGLKIEHATRSQQFFVDPYGLDQ